MVEAIIARNDDLLRYIAAAPEDDAPRLVYADWLDENDHPDEAEFIRRHIEYCRTVNDVPWRRRRMDSIEPYICTFLWPSRNDPEHMGSHINNPLFTSRMTNAAYRIYQTLVPTYARNETPFQLAEVFWRGFPELVALDSDLLHHQSDLGDIQERIPLTTFVDLSDHAKPKKEAFARSVVGNKYERYWQFYQEHQQPWNPTRMLTVNAFHKGRTISRIFRGAHFSHVFGVPIMRNSQMHGSGVVILPIDTIYNFPTRGEEITRAFFNALEIATCRIAVEREALENESGFLRPTGSTHEKWESLGYYHFLNARSYERKGGLGQICHHQNCKSPHFTITFVCEGDVKARRGLAPYYQCYGTKCKHGLLTLSYPSLLLPSSGEQFFRFPIEPNFFYSSAYNSTHGQPWHVANLFQPEGPYRNDRRPTPNPMRRGPFSF